MNWIFFASMMFITSIINYLLVRKSSLLKIPNRLVNLAMFGIPLVVYIIIAIVKGTTLMIEWWHLPLLFIIAIVFAYLGNKSSLRAIDLAPNPGYSLVLSKSYVLFTTLVAVVFMGGGRGIYLAKSTGNTVDCWLFSANHGNT